MKLHTVLIFVIFLGLLCMTIRDSVFYFSRFETKAELAHKVYVQKVFIAESFKNTCCGNGFSDLEEWQKCCRQMFSLEYIAWCPAQEFMIDEQSNNLGELMYGKWICKNESSKASGEIYCRMKSGDKGSINRSSD